jgi:hypothetical protein
MRLGLTSSILGIMICSTPFSNEASICSAWTWAGRVIERLSCYRRLQVRWDRGSARWFGLVLLACALVCFNRL